MTDTWYDNGEALRLASTIWILIGCIALFASLFAVYRQGIRLRGRLSLRFTSRSVLMLTVVVAMVIVLIRPPLSDAIPVSRSLPALGLFLMAIIALHRPEVMNHIKRPVRIEIPNQHDIERN